MYQYNPLQNGEIRLLTVGRKLPHVPLCLQLEHASLRSKPRYFALSYTWGLPGPNFPAEWGDKSTKVVKLSGEDFHVQYNLHSALHLLESEFEAGTKFWIDAICINQSSVKERNHQVTLMRDIYSTAQMTIVWLGPPDAESQTAIRKIERCYEERAEETIRLDLREKIKQDIRDKASRELSRILEFEFGNATRVKEWTAVANLLKRFYWTRVWIIQEIAVAKGVLLYCGTFRISWLALDQVCWMVNEWAMATVSNAFTAPSYAPILANLDAIHMTCQNLSTLRSFRVERSPVNFSRAALPLGLALTGHCQASDPKDKLYAVLGLSENTENVKPNYDENVTVEEVFRQFAIACIRTKSSLGILGFCSYSPNATHPSWVPFLGDSNKHNYPISTEYIFNTGSSGRQRLYSAGSDGALEVNFKNDYKTLCLKAAGVDTLRFVASVRMDSPGVDELHQWASYYSQHKNSFPLIDPAGWKYKEADGYAQFNTPILKGRNESLKEAFELTMNADRVIEADTNLGHRITDKLLNAVGTGLMRWNIDADGSQVRKDRTFAVSDMGLFCLVPMQAKPDDILLIVPGAEVPYVVRELRPDDNKGYLIGECYVHNAMDGGGLEHAIFKTGLEDIELI
jgi:Heterokaryon incompatibility protein (HET)